MTQKKNDCEIILIDEEQRKPIKILKKNVNHMGAIKYLVEYPNDQQWESEKYMKEKYLELVEDYNYFSVCGSRYDQATLNQKRENHLKLASYDSHNYSNLPIIPHDDNYPIFKRQKIKDKQSEKMSPTDSQPAITVSRALVENQVQITQQLNTNKADLGDTIKSISIENGLFLIEWNQRTDSTIPYAEYYTYDQLKATAPNILLQFLEKELLEKDLKFKQLKRDKICEEIVNNPEGQASNKKNDPQNIPPVIECIQPEEVKEQSKEQKDIQNGEKKNQIIDNKEQKDQKDQKVQVDQRKDQNEIKVNAPQVTIEAKPPTEKIIQPNQILKKKGVVPSIKPSEKIISNGPQKTRKPPEQPITNVSDQQIKERPQNVQNQLVTISNPSLFKQQSTSDQLDIFECSKNQQIKQDSQKYQKDLDECYSDVEIPQFQFNQLEF